MATLPRVECPAGAWTVISGGMASGMNYAIQTNNHRRFFIVESNTDPTDAQSRFAEQSLTKVPVEFTGTEFRVFPIEGAITIEIQTAV